MRKYYYGKIIEGDPTRGDALIDFFIINNESLPNNFGVLDPNLSDHKLTFVGFQYEKKRKKQKTRIVCRNYNKLNYDLLAREIVKSEFTSDETNVDSKVAAFSSECLKCYNSVVPKTVLSFVPKCKTPSFTQATIDSIKYRNELRKRWSKCKTDYNWQLYTQMKKECRLLINHDTRSYYDRIITSEGAWGALKKLRDKQLPDISLTADELNQYFATVTSSDMHVNVVKPSYFPDVPSKLRLQTAFPKDLFAAWRSIKNKNKKTEDVLGIAPIMINLCIGCPSVADALLEIVNTSIKTSTFPTACNLSIITPIPKINSPKDVSDFRPISVQSNLAKIIEKCVHTKLTEYFDNHNLFSPSQFGFRKRSSTEHALIDISHFIRDKITDKEEVIIVQLDLTKAFDKVNHVLLLEKLEWYGVDPTWFKSYLEDRTHQTKIENCLSGPQYSKSGVPQGSILGPLLFTIFINDMPLVLKHTIPILYADDSHLCHSAPSTDLRKMCDEINEDLQNISLWMKNNGMMLNAKKCKYIRISPSASTKYIL